MTRLLIVSAITTLLISCVLDKSKTANEEIQDSTVNSTSGFSPKFESSTLTTNYPFRLTIHEGSNWNLKIDSVTGKEFDQKKKEVHQKKKVNGDSLIIAFSAMFKDAVILDDSCCILKGWDKDLKVCQRQPSNDREWTGYKGVDYNHGYLILMEWGYESWSYISFNPKTRKYTYMSNEPHFIDNNLIYSAGNYYAEGQFQITNVKENKYFGFETFNWELTGSYNSENSIYMEFTSHMNKRYLKVTFS